MVTSICIRHSFYCVPKQRNNLRKELQLVNLKNVKKAVESGNTLV